ncbi:FGGY-family carbohydrate kinase [Pediococcus acidilactici]|nr:FGGY-family carbohydrate kinase [Pediococcus acidilactici]EOA09043.1 rhamnulokinase, rhaB [Pediococcus acidilactici D3]MCW8082724.1 FGGY-family carbohydrate kinase [Pediococcus acidilactici]MDB8856516.1 FGGY-family carbohydrate kinase [Pediococcus acidilactici]MDL2054639.1 FGGY-family carbohydrate kinase [Pediococcus acidilactici]MDQ7762131.1 FGGY-family carbohydrate kinase [Pediococcus acidilactici]
MVLESLAFSYRQVIEKLEKLTGTTLQKVHMFGGGIQNQLLVQLTADFTQRKVVTGPVEASVLGNVVAQLKVLGKITDPVKLDVLANTVDVQDFNPTEIPGLEQKYAQFMRILAANNTEGK